jgi:hypothetical protein
MSIKQMLQDAASDESRYPTFQFVDDPRASKVGGEEILAKVIGNRVSGKLTEIRVVDVPENGASVQKIVLNVEVDAKTKGFVKVEKSMPKKFDADEHPVVVVWVNPKGNMIKGLLAATDGTGDLFKGQKISIELTGCYHSGKHPNGAYQYDVKVGAAPVNIAAPADDADDDGMD